MAMVKGLVPMAYVGSVPRAIEFYRKLGFAVRNTFTPPGQYEFSWAWLESGAANLMVSRASEPVVASQQAVLFYLYADDVQAFHAKLELQGVAVGEIEDPFYSPRGEFRVTDPDGYVLIVSHT